MKKHALLIITIGSLDHASSRIRAINYLPFLSENFKVKLFARRGLRNYKSKGLSVVCSFFDKYYRKLNLFFVIIFKRYNYVVIQREYIPIMLLYLLKFRKTVIFYDVDDAIYLEDPKSFYQRFKFYKGIIVSTPLLKQKFSHYDIPTKVVYSPVYATNNTLTRVKNKPIRICWIGSPSTSKYLKIIEEPLKRLKQEVDFVLVLVGADSMMLDLPIERVVWSIEQEKEVLRTSDIGIMPLLDSEWEEMKGGYKILLYMSAGIPVVASPIGFNKVIVKDGENGFLPATQEQWYLRLKNLIIDEVLRSEMGLNNSLEVEAKYSYKVNADKLINFIIAEH